MKPTQILLIVACFSIICAMFGGLASALNQDEATASVVWVSPPIQNSNATAMIVFQSNSSDTLTIYYIGVHFDWMAADSFFGLNLANNPVTVESHGSHTFDSMSIPIPATATAGAHSYYVGIDGVQGVSTNFSWDSTPLMVQIQGGSSGGSFSQLEAAVNSSLTNAINANYKSPNAQSLLQQAQTAYQQALTLESQGNLSGALTSLQSASTYLTQADAAERSYSGGGNQTLLLIIIAVVVAAVVAVLAVILIVRRRRKQAAPAEVSQTPETPQTPEAPAAPAAPET